MSLPGSGPLSLSQIAGEFPNFLNTSNVVVSGSSAPHRMSDFYAAIPSVPSSGAIAISNFRGKSGTFTYTIDENIDRVNLRTYLLSKGWDGTVLVYLTLAAGRYLWSSDTSTPAVTTGSFPRGLIFTNDGFIMGMGGRGGDVRSNGFPGGDGMTINCTCRIVNNGYIAGGGGGGAGNYRDDAGRDNGSGGGGGAGGGRGGDGYSTRTGGSGGSIGNAGSNGIGSNGLEGRGGSAGGSGGGFNQRDFFTDDSGGGGGGGRIFPGTRRTGPDGGYGGAPNEPGGDVAGGNAGAGGGGGWGARGGNVASPSRTGGAGGRAILKNGNFVFVQGTTSNIYGSIVS